MRKGTTAIKRVKQIQRSTFFVVALSAAFFSGLPVASAQQKPLFNKMDQATLNHMAETIAVVYQVLDNRKTAQCAANEAQGFCFRASLTLTSPHHLQNPNWQLYFSHITPIRKVEGDQFTIEHINGDLHRIAPTSKFIGFKANTPQTLTFYSDYWQLSETDPMPNYYFAAANLEPAIIESTRPVIDPETGLESLPFVAEIKDPEKQFKRSPDDKTRWATAAELFHTNADVPLLTQHIASAIIPTPKQVSLDQQGRYLNLSAGIRVRNTGIDRKHLHAALARLAKFGINEQPPGIPVDIQLINPPQPAGSYTLDIQTSLIRIKTSDPEGAANALNSLASLVKLGDLNVPLMRVEDSPRYGFRGLHIDVARNFHSKAVILKILDQMAAYKLNKLHLHLGDDEGWRMEIPGLPELTEIGSRRCHDLKENRCLLPQLGSGPQSDSSVNGYYSIADYQDILGAASARHIQVIPSFDMPGHARAAVKAMEARFRRLHAEGKHSEAKQYLLSDPKDTSEYRSVQHYHDNTINVCLESSYAFIEKVIDTMRHIHQQAAHPLSRYHIGADETAGAWQGSPACKDFMQGQENRLTTEKLGAYFIERVAAMLTSKNIEVAAWSDGLAHTRLQAMPKTLQSNAWTPLFWNGHKSAHQQANQGWQVVISSPDASYFDFPYEADPKERGYYWGARQVNTRKVFQFMPDNLPAHAEFWTDRNGKPMTIDDRPQRDKKGQYTHIPLKANVGFTGVQGHLWSETVRSDQQVEYMLFPRLLALSERAWHKAAWELPYQHDGAIYSPQSGFFSEAALKQREADWYRFANTLGQKELAKLDYADIHFRLPTVGADVQQGKLKLNTAFPGLTMEYRLRNGKWQKFKAELPTKNLPQWPVEVRSVAPISQRRGRRLTLHSKS